MAVLYDKCFGKLKYTLCPPNIGVPDDLYKYATHLTIDGTIRNDAPEKFRELHKASYTYDEATGTNVFRWIGGKLCVPKSVPEKVINMIFYNTFAPPSINAHSYQFFQVEEGDVVVDGGAYEGFYTADCFAQGASRVIAFEPLPSMRSVMGKNFGNRDKLKVHQALGSRNASTVVHDIGEGTSVHGRMAGRGKQITVGMSTIDTIAAKYKTKIDLIKLDVEGSEFDALVGARDTIQSHKPKLIIETYHRWMDAFLIYRLLTSIRDDYSILLWGRWTGSMVPDEAYRPCKPYTLVAW